MKDWKFRGYDAVGEKGWVTGDLAHDKKITVEGLEPRVKVGGYEVVPGSVCLFTGLVDSNGVDIYEGDIIRISYNGKKVYDALVVWNSYYASFLMNEGDGCYSPIPNAALLTEITVEVIGNVYENEDLLKNVD